MSRLRDWRWLVATLLTVAVLAIGCGVAWSWANHLGIQPWSLPLACRDVDPFRCHADASRALAELRAEAPHVRHTLPTEMARVSVARTDPLDFCREKHCPVPVIKHLEQITHQERVTVTYRSLDSIVGSDVIDISTFKDGGSEVLVQQPIQLRVPI